MNNHRKRVLLEKQNNFVKVTTIKPHECFININKAIDYLKQGYTVKELLKGITVTLHSVNTTTKQPYSYSVIDRFNGLQKDLNNLYKEEQKLNIIRERDVNGRLTTVGLITKVNEKSFIFDPIKSEIQHIFRSNETLKSFAY